MADPLETAAYKALDPFSIAHSPETIESLYVAFCYQYNLLWKALKVRMNNKEDDTWTVP